MRTLAELVKAGINVDSFMAVLSHNASLGDRDAANNLSYLERERRAEQASQRANANLDPEQRRILGSVFKGVPNTTGTIRATMRGPVLTMPQATPTREQARARLKELDEELEAIHREMTGGR